MQVYAPVLRSKKQARFERSEPVDSGAPEVRIANATMRSDESFMILEEMERFSVQGDL